MIKEYPRLCAVELCGFKSFRDSERISLNPNGVTYVVGDNGSGKSNIIDGICFVMGMKSRLMRCNSCDETIHWNRTECCVTLEFTNGDLISRTHRLGQSSTYRHNNKIISSSDCCEVFIKEFGIDPSFPERFIILQNVTQALISQSCGELLRCVLNCIL